VESVPQLTENRLPIWAIYEFAACANRGCGAVR
jgi:hypothetical protein